MHLTRSKLAAGWQGEEVIERWLSQFYHLTPANKTQQKQGIDFIGIHKITKEQTTFEVKADSRASETNNAVIELGHWVGDRLHRQGWLYTCQADQFLYLLPQRSLVYMMKLSTVRTRLDNLLPHYPTVDVPNEYHGLHQVTRSLLIPLWQLARLSEGCVTIQSKFPAHYHRAEL